MRLSKEKREELKALAEKDRAKTLDYLAWEGYGLASRQALPDALADIEELEARCEMLETQATCDHTPEFSKEHDDYYCSKCHKGMGNAFYGAKRGREKAESKLADAVKALEDIKENGYGAWVEPTLAKLKAK